MDRSELRKAILGNYPAILAFFRARLTGERADHAEDLAQETMIAAFNAFADGAPVDIHDPASYVLGIARRKLAHLIRDGYRRPTVSLIVRSDEKINAVVLKASAELQMVEREQIARLAEAMESLSQRDRRVLLLLYNEGLGNSEVAARIGQTPDNTSRIKYRALEKLRRLLGDDRTR